MYITKDIHRNGICLGIYTEMILQTCTYAYTYTYTYTYRCTCHNVFYLMKSMEVVDMYVYV